ncbi:MAG: SH3 domain-containing protein [Chlamydiota bacterium]
MKRIVTKSMLASMLLALPFQYANSNETVESKDQSQEKPVEKKEKKPFKSFTGKVVKNRVRMRLQPSLESPILRELNKDEMVVVINEDDEFYSVEPPEDIKAYIFRTYVLDGTVEGHHVNVRLDPTLDSPVVAQLNTGDSITGRVSPSNSKWLEILPPEGTYFYVSKDYIENVGDSSYMAKVNKRRDDVNQLLDSAYMASHQDGNKPFEEIDYEAIVQKYDNIIQQYTDFEQQVTRARELLVDFKDQYTKKKIAYLEAKSKNFIDAESLQKENNRLSKAYKQQLKKLNELENQVGSSKQIGHKRDATIANSPWLPQEEVVYAKWTEENTEGSMDDFYEDEADKAINLKGMVQPYNRNVKNKPGDYVLLNSYNTPIAFLYSTKVNLQDHVGQEVSITGSPRPNNRFAYPAYHVMSVE